MLRPLCAKLRQRAGHFAVTARAACLLHRVPGQVAAHFDGQPQHLANALRRQSAAQLRPGDEDIHTFVALHPGSQEIGLLPAYGGEAGVVIALGKAGEAGIAIAQPLGSANEQQARLDSISAVGHVWRGADIHLR